MLFCVQSGNTAAYNDILTELKNKGYTFTGIT